MINNTLTQALYKNFLGHSAENFKITIIVFLIINPLMLMTFGAFITGWLLIIEFIYCLAMALKCYPLQSGGLLAIEAVLLNLTTAEALYELVTANIEVILLLIFMVAGIYFMQQLLLLIFTKVLINIRNKILLSLIFCSLSAVMSAFLDALTVTAVLISVSLGFYSVYHRVASGKDSKDPLHNHGSDSELQQQHTQCLEGFRHFLQSLLMHGVVGTALGGVSTMVGEPQNLLIAHELGWNFIEFFQHMSTVSLPVLFTGLALCMLLEKFQWFSYGAQLPEPVFQVLKDYDDTHNKNISIEQKAKYLVQSVGVIFLVTALALQWAEVGLIGLAVIVLLTSFNGVVEEHQIGEAFKEALPFTALLIVFFTIVSMIHQQGLFAPLISYVLLMPAESQPSVLFIFNGLLSMISDNVFVASVYISEIKTAYLAGDMTREQFEHLAVAVNTGTNIPSVATPNGQAAFLFLLTSAIAPLIRLSYLKMVWMALPYTIVLSLVTLLCVKYFV